MIKVSIVSYFASLVRVCADYLCKRSLLDHPASKRTKDDEERVEGDDISQEEIQRRVDLPLDVWMMSEDFFDSFCSLHN